MFKYVESLLLFIVITPCVQAAKLNDTFQDKTIKPLINPLENSVWFKNGYQRFIFEGTVNSYDEKLNSAIIDMHPADNVIIHKNKLTFDSGTHNHSLNLFYLHEEPINIKEYRYLSVKQEYEYETKYIKNMAMQLLVFNEDKIIAHPLDNLELRHSGCHYIDVLEVLSATNTKINGIGLSYIFPNQNNIHLSLSELEILKLNEKISYKEYDEQNGNKVIETTRFFSPIKCSFNPIRPQKLLGQKNPVVEIKIATEHTAPELQPQMSNLVPEQPPQKATFTQLHQPKIAILSKPPIILQTATEGTAPELQPQTSNQIPELQPQKATFTQLHQPKIAILSKPPIILQTATEGTAPELQPQTSNQIPELQPQKATFTQLHQPKTAVLSKPPVVHTATQHTAPQLQSNTASYDTEQIVEENPVPEPFSILTMATGIAAFIRNKRKK